MQIRRHADVAETLGRARGYLEAREAEHCLLLGILGGLEGDPRPGGREPYLAVVEGNDGGVVGVAVRTPPFGLVISEIAAGDAEEEREIVARIAAGAAASSEDLPTVLGPTRAAAAFAEVWAGLTGARPRLGMRERIHCADEVTAPAGVSGAMRDEEPADRERLVLWMGDFAAEAGLPEPRLEPGDWLERRHRKPGGGFVIWEDGGEPVAFAGYGDPTAHGIRIGPVYTPPERRRRGYASALTAALTERLLRGGRRSCFLFTDLANPTSNSIYARIGYRPVQDVDQWAFLSP